MEKQKHSLPRITRFITGLEKTNEYLGSLGKDTRFHALGHAAHVYADRMEREKPKDPAEMLDQIAVRMIASLPGFIEGSRGLEAIRRDEENGQRVHKSEKTPLLEAVIPFNHILRKLIDTFPDFTFEQAQNYCSQMTFEMSSIEDAAYCKHVVRETLAGMRNEIGMSQILWKVEGVEAVLPAESVNEEMRGVDLTVIYHGKPLELDAKASNMGAQKALKNREDYMVRNGISERDNRSGYPVWPRIEYEDFGGGFRISEETAMRLAPRMKTLLDDLYRQKRGSAVA